MSLRDDWIRHLARTAQIPTDGQARRRFLRQAIWSTTAIGLGLSSQSRAQPVPKTRFIADPFTLGVASGYPHPTGFTLWTRLAPAPLLANGGIEDDKVSVRCEVASDERFAHIEQQIEFLTSPEIGCSAHLDIEGLAPGRDYFYRFIAGDAVSAVGRTHTAPALGALDRYRVAFASCQNYEHGYFTAYRQMAKDAPNLVLFLGDYIYENQWGDNSIRRHIGPEANTLAGYRLRHAQYKLDPDLQAMHLLGPWAFCWDDHEVDNDYAAEISETLDPGFVLRRAAAYQAYYEHLPLPRRMRPQGHAMRTYTHLDIGDLLRIYLLDDRQYRTPQPCPAPNRQGSRTLDRCDELLDPQQTMLGTEQEAWLGARFQDSKAHWNLIGQQTIFTPVDESPGAERGVWTDGWDAYPLSRAKVMHDLAAARVSNPVIAGGDLHCATVASVPSDPANLESRSIASEFVATSLSADARPQSYYDRNRSENPHIQQMRSDQRGYTLLDFDRKRLQASLQVVKDVRVREPEFATQARYVVESGTPEPRAV
jgi:alkaline phosphatase D